MQRADTLGEARCLWRPPEREKSFMSRPPNGRNQGSASEPGAFAFPALQKAVEQKDRWTFAHMARTLPWQDHHASDLLQAIDWALALDAVETARELAQHGRKLFPDDERLRQVAAVLAPPFSWEHAPANRPDLTLRNSGSRRMHRGTRGSGSPSAPGRFSGQLQRSERCMNATELREKRRRRSSSKSYRNGPVRCLAHRAWFRRRFGAL